MILEYSQTGLITFIYLLENVLYIFYSKQTVELICLKRYDFGTQAPPPPNIAE